LDKSDNDYLNYFQQNRCKIGIEMRNIPKTQRVHINLSPEPGPIKMNPKSNTPQRKPTLMELLNKPKFRIYFTHQETNIYGSLKEHLENHTSIYTPCLGLASLLANFEFIGEFDYSIHLEGDRTIFGVIPTKNIKNLDPNRIREQNNEIMQIGMYPLEMDMERNVTERDNILFDRNLKPITATVFKTANIKNYLIPNFHISLF